MANEVNLSCNFSVSKNGATVAPGSFSKQITMTNDGMAGNVQNIGTSSEALVLTDIASPGYFVFKNLDTGSKQIAVSSVNPAASATSLVMLKAGEFAMFPSRLTSMYAIAYGGAANLFVGACEL